MEEEFVALKWGDIVRIHGVNLSKRSITKGLIISKGFTDANIYYQTYNDFSQVNFYRESLFQILPRTNFDMHDQLLDQTLSEQMRENLQNRAEGEITTLEVTLSAKAGKEIKYGSEVIFRHIQSKSYMSGMMQAANSGEGAFKIQVSESLSSFVIFKLVSPRSFQNENDIVYYTDALRIYHPKSDSFMNFCQTGQPISLDTLQILPQIPSDHASQKFVSQRPFIKQPNDVRTFIVNENKSKCLWKFIQHCSNQQYVNKQKIKSHDIVYFKHTKKQEESLVSTSINKPLVSYLKQNQDGNLSYECFWELIPKQVNQLGPENCNLFWARNIVTGQLLQYDNFSVEIEKNGNSEGKGFDNRGLINLICSEQQQGKATLKLERDHQLLCSSDISKIEQEYEKKNKKFSFKAVPVLPKDIFMIFKVDQQLLLDAMYIMSSHQFLIKLVEKLSSYLVELQTNGNEDYPHFFAQFQEEELANIVKIEKMLTGKIYGTNYQNITASGNIPNKTVQQILVQSGIVQILIQIIYHLYKPFKFIERNNEPSEDRAIRVKIAQIFQHTYILLEKVAANFQQNRIYISRWMDLFLEHSNNINKSYIQQCLVGILHSNPVAIRATIDEEKIKNLIQNFFKEAKQNKKGVPLTTKYLRLFSTFIKGQSSVIKENQNIVLNHFFKNPSNELNFKFKVEYKNEGGIDDEHDPYKVKSKQVFIIFGKQKPMTLPQFFNENSANWNYLMAYVSLLADICIDRNNLAIESVSSILSLQAVAVILFDTQVQKLNYRIKQENKEASSKNGGEKLYTIENIHQPFIRIAHHVYVDNHKFQQIKRIMRIFQWHKDAEQQSNSGFEDINRTNRVFEGEKQEQQQRYLQSILEYIKAYIKNCNQSTNLHMLLTILNLLKSTVILGLWRSIKFFRQLAPELMLKITKIENNFFFEKDPKSRTSYSIVEANKQKLKMNRPEIALSIQCKIKTIEIFKYMNQLQIDIRLRYIMNFFKGLYQCTQNFNIYDLPLSEDVKQDANEKQVDRNQIARQQYLKMEGKALLGDVVKKVTEDVDIILKQNVWFNKLKQLTPFEYSKQDDPMKDRYIFQGENIDMQKQNCVEELNRQFNTIVLGLFELTAYENYKLLNSSLYMLRIMFEQRKDLLNNFKKILICGKGNLEQVYLTLKFMREKFNMLANNNIQKYEGDADKSFPYEIKKPYDYLIKDREKRSGIIQDLFFLSRTLKDGTSLKNIQALMSVDDDVFIPDQIYNFINEKQKNNELFQALNLAEGIYKPLIEYIKIVNKKQCINNSNHRKLLLSIYQYLTLLCFNNLEAKQILMPFIPHILPHLKSKVGAANFLYQVTRNNKLLVSNEELVSLIIEKCLESCVQLQIGFAFVNVFGNFLSMPATNNDLEKSRILFALRGVLLYNDQGYKRNQEILMNRLQDNRYNKFIYQGPIKYKANLNDFNLSPQQTFIAYDFELFSVLVESGNMINIGKLENLHPYQYCLDCLESTNRWEIRRALRAYINRLYYVNKDKDIFLFQKFIRKEFDILNTELGDLVDLHRKKLLTEDLKIKNGIRFSYAQSQIFLFIIQCLITLHEMFLKPGFISILRRELEKDDKNKDYKPLHQKFIKLYKNLGCLKRIYDKVKIIDPFIRQVNNLMTGELNRMAVRFLQKKAEPDDDKNKNQQQQIMTNSLIPSSPGLQPGQAEKKNYSYDQSKSFFRNLANMIKFLHNKQHLDKLKQNHQKSKKQVNIPEHQLKKRYIQTIFSVPNQKLRKYYSKRSEKKVLQYDPHLQTANSRIFKVLAKPQLGQNEQNIELNINLNEVKNMIEDSPTFDKFKDDQFIFFVNKTLGMNETSIEQYSNNWKQIYEEPQPVITVNEIMTKIFKLIMENPKNIADEQKIFVIKMVRCFLTEAVESKQSYKLGVDKWQADYCGEDKQFMKRQEQIQACGGSDFIISIFKQNLSDRIELLNEALLLGIAYLYGGNHTCQNSILKSLMKDPQNVMLTHMKNMIKTIGDFLINIRKIKQNEKKRNFAYNIVDTYDYFNSEDMMIAKYFGQSKLDKFEVQIQLDNEKALCRIFRFLQLFCENNNKEMKKFLYTQIKDDGSIKPNTINFIEQACILLKKLFKIMNNKLVMIPNSLLAFIGEITQVPILQNQKSFIKSTFFEDISYMASFFDSTENKLQRKFNPVAQSDEDPLNTLSEIYKQAVKLALSNFEGNQNIIIKQFLNKCQPNFLWLIIRDELWTLLKKKYLNFSFIFYDETNDKQSRVNTFKNLTKKNIQQVVREQKKKKDFDGNILSIIQVFIILRKIDDYAIEKQAAALGNRQIPNPELSSDAKKARDFQKQLIRIGEEQFPVVGQFIEVFNHLILQIEINCQNGNAEKLQHIYFPNHPVFEYLAGTTKDRIMVEVNRNAPRDKLISLLGFREEVYDEIKSNFDMNFFEFNLNVFGRKVSKSISITSQLSEFVRKAAGICSYIIIIFMFYLVLAEHEVVDDVTTYFTYTGWKSRFTLKFMCAIQLFLMLLYVATWYMLRGELAFKKYLKSLHQGQQQQSQETQTQLNEVRQFNINELLVSQVIQQRDKTEEKKEHQNKILALAKTIMHRLLAVCKKVVKKCAQNYYIQKLLLSIHKVFSYFYNVIYLRILAVLNQSDFKPIAFFLITSILGNFFGVEWYTTHLFNLFVGIPELINVFKAIIANIKLLFILSCLATLFVMVFNILSLNTYVPVIYEDELPQQSCESILDCVLVVYTSGAINGDMESFQLFRFSFDIVYVVFMELLFQSLIGGIMIDAYMGLTEEDKERENDKKGKCYICSKEKSEIQKEGQTFTKHTHKHFLWNYLYYIYCLENKDPTDYTGIEYIVFNKIQQENVSWFPSVGASDDAQIELVMSQLAEKIECMGNNQMRLCNRLGLVYDESTKAAKSRIGAISAQQMPMIE